MRQKVKRCRYDVIADVLYLLRAQPEGMRITELCTRANLPVDRGLGLLEELESRGLVYVLNEGGHRVFRITESGYVYLGLYEELKRVLGEVRELTKREFRLYYG